MSISQRSGVQPMEACVPPLVLLAEVQLSRFQDGGAHLWGPQPQCRFSFGLWRLSIVALPLNWQCDPALTPEPSYGGNDSPGLTGITGPIE